MNCIRFTDDIVTLPDTELDMNNMLNTLNDALKQFILRINARKTKTMFICKEPIKPQIHIEIYSIFLQQVK